LALIPVAPDKAAENPVYRPCHGGKIIPAGKSLRGEGIRLIFTEFGSTVCGTVWSAVRARKDRQNILNLQQDRKTAMSSHVDTQGNVMMVDVGDKKITHRTAEAGGFIFMSETALQKVREGSCSKGDVLTVAQLAGITALKRTADIIPLCHPLTVSGCKVELFLEDAGIRVLCRVMTTGQTGVEMEALTGASAALLTVYDMCKSIDKDMEISGICLLKKTGGKSGDYRRA
jgi:cyclic pyranopterin phosphate synthase